MVLKKKINSNPLHESVKYPLSFLLNISISILTLPKIRERETFNKGEQQEIKNILFLLNELTIGVFLYSHGGLHENTCNHCNQDPDHPNPPGFKFKCGTCHLLLLLSALLCTDLCSLLSWKISDELILPLRFQVNMSTNWSKKGVVPKEKHNIYIVHLSILHF